MLSSTTNILSKQFLNRVFSASIATSSTMSSIQEKQFYGQNDHGKFSVLQTQNTDWSILLSTSTSNSQCLLASEKRFLKELFAELLKRTPTTGFLSQARGSLTSIAPKTLPKDYLDQTNLTKTEESLSRALIEKNSPKLVLKIDSSVLLKEECRIGYSGSKTLAVTLSSLLEKVGFATSVHEVQPKSGTETLNKEAQPNLLDFQLAASLVRCADSRKELSKALVSSLSDNYLVDFATRKPETQIPIPSDLDLLCDVMLKCNIPPKVKVVQL